jgi:ATP-dependent Zn protease
VFAVTCYFRHLGEVFKKAGIEVTKENRQKIDRVIHDLVNTKYKDCPATWKEVKKRLAEDEAGFVLKLKAAWNSQR